MTDYQAEKPKHPGGRPSTYDPAYCQQVIDLGAEGKSPVQISAAINVPRTTMQSWGEAHPEFSAALSRAKELEQAFWEELGLDGIKADKFNALVWKVSMQARFRHDYTERKEHELSGKGGAPLIPAINVTVGSSEPSSS